MTKIVPIPSATTVPRMMIVQSLLSALLISTGCAGEPPRAGGSIFSSPVCVPPAWSTPGRAITTDNEGVFVLGTSFLSELDPQGGVRWKQGLHATSPHKPARYNRTTTGPNFSVSEPQLFEVRDAIVNFADQRYYAAEVEVRSGNLVSMLGGYKQFEVQESQEVVAFEGGEFSWEPRGTLWRAGTHEKSFPDHRLLSCGEDEFVALVHQNGKVFTVDDEGNTRRRGRVPRSDGPVTPYLSKGDLEWATVKESTVRSDKGCWELPEPIDQISTTRHGFAALAQGKVGHTGRLDDGMVYFLAFQTKSDVVPCRWVSNRARIVDLRDEYNQPD